MIVGLGNPGQQYRETRHNAGAQYVEEIARRFNAPLKEDKNFFGLSGRANIKGHDVRLLIPTTFMNLSGKATVAMARFYKVNIDEILVAHDELDLNPGIVRLKVGGGHGGHNGLKDIIQKHGNNKNFARLRLGIGHPGSAEQVSGFVLAKAPAKEYMLTEKAIDEAVDHVGMMLDEGLQKTMNSLNRFKASA